MCYFAYSLFLYFSSQYAAVFRLSCCAVSIYSHICCLFLKETKSSVSVGLNVYPHTSAQQVHAFFIHLHETGTIANKSDSLVNFGVSCLDCNEQSCTLSCRDQRVPWFFAVLISDFFVRLVLGLQKCILSGIGKLRSRYNSSGRGRSFLATFNLKVFPYATCNSLFTNFVSANEARKQLVCRHTSARKRKCVYQTYRQLFFIVLAIILRGSLVPGESHPQKTLRTSLFQW